MARHHFGRDPDAMGLSGMIGFRAGGLTLEQIETAILRIRRLDELRTASTDSTR
jgi:hypothetical protein